MLGAEITGGNPRSPQFSLQALRTKAANTSGDGASPVVIGRAAMVVYASSVDSGIVGDSPNFHRRGAGIRKEGNDAPNPGSTPSHLR